jgi:hypothetical protein
MLAQNTTTGISYDFSSASAIAFSFMVAESSLPNTSNSSCFSYKSLGAVMKSDSLSIVLIFFIPASPLNVALTPKTFLLAFNY